MAEYTLSYWEPYILGNKKTESKSKPVRADATLLQKFVDCLSGDNVSTQIFNNCVNAVDFYDAAVDFKYFIPKEQRKEIFYAAKLDKYYPEVPSLCVYLIQMAWQKCLGIPNLVIKYLSKSMLTEFCAEGYFADGVTLHDVICNLCSEEYVPVSETKPKNKMKDFTELYVRATDMVAAVPHAIADLLSDADVLEIAPTPYGLSCKGTLLRTMCGHYGIVNSVYDLRSVI